MRPWVSKGFLQPQQHSSASGSISFPQSGQVMTPSSSASRNNFIVDDICITSIKKKVKEMLPDYVGFCKSSLVGGRNELVGWMRFGCVLLDCWS